MGLDLFTLMVMTQMVSAVCGILFLVEATGGRSQSSWSFAWAFLCAPLAALSYSLAASHLQLVDGYPIGNGIATGTLALTWCGARVVNGRRPYFLVAVAVPLVMTISVIATARDIGAWTGAYPFFACIAGFALAGAVEFIRGRTGETRTINASILAAICLFDGVFYIVRGLGLWFLGPDHLVFRLVLGPEIATMVLTLLIVVSSFSLTALGTEHRCVAQIRGDA